MAIVVPNRGMQKQDKVQGLGLGADNYVAKTVALGCELLARVQRCSTSSSVRMTSRSNWEIQIRLSAVFQEESEGRKVALFSQREIEVLHYMNDRVRGKVPHA